MEFTPGMKLRLVQFIIGYARNDDGLLVPRYIPAGAIVKVQNVDAEGIALAYTSGGVELDIYPDSRVEPVVLK